jgi:hypothetical protein
MSHVPAIVKVSDMVVILGVIMTVTMKIDITLRMFIELARLLGVVVVSVHA